MEKRELERMFDRLAPTPEQEQAVLDRLLELEKEETPVKNVKRIFVFGLAAALMVISCAAAAVTGIDQRLAQYFGAESEEDLGLIEPADVAVNESHTYPNGWTVEISQVLADRLSLAVLVDITAPEGTVLSGEEELALRLTQLDSQGNQIVSGGPQMRFVHQLEDGSPADNHMTVLWQVRKAQGEESVPYTGGSLELTPLAVYFQKGDQMVPARFNDGGADTWWSCTVDLPDTDPGITYSMDQPLTIGRAQIRLTGIYLSPLSLTVYVEDKEQDLRAPEWEDPEEHQEEWEDYWEMQQLVWEDNVFLDLRDGTQLAAAGSQGKVVGVSYTFRFDQILDPEDVVSVTLFGQTFELK